jgi:glucokinase
VAGGDHPDDDAGVTGMGGVAGVDLGGTKIQTVVLRSGQIVGQARAPTPQTGAGDVVDAISAAVRQAQHDAGAHDQLVAVGIGSPGEIDAEHGVVAHSPNVPGFDAPVKLGSLVSGALGGVPVRLDNDVRVAIRGEHERGAGRPFDDLLGVFVGTGVGGGLVLGGEIYGGGGAGGEIGHTTVKDGGRMCSDGRRGHLEAYAGRGRIEAEARRRVDEGSETILFTLMERKGRTRLTSGVIARALEREDALATELIDDAVWALGVALSNAQNLLDLQAIIIGGGLGDRLGRSFVDRIAEAMRPRLFVPERAPKMLTTELGDLAGAVGAAVLAGS